jgi:hypothetical protein
MDVGLPGKVELVVQAFLEQPGGGACLRGERLGGLGVLGVRRARKEDDSDLA